MAERHAKRAKGDKQSRGSQDALVQPRREARVHTLGEADSLIPAKDVAPDSRAESSDYIQVQLQRLASLSGRERELLRLRYGKSWSLGTISLQLGMSDIEVRRLLTTVVARALIVFAPSTHDQIQDFESLFAQLMAPQSEESETDLPAALLLVTCSEFLKRHVPKGRAGNGLLDATFRHMAEKNLARSLIWVVTNWLNDVHLIPGLLETYEFANADQVANLLRLAQGVESSLIREGRSAESRRLVTLLVDSLVPRCFKPELLDKVSNTDYISLFIEHYDKTSNRLADEPSNTPDRTADPATRHAWSSNVDDAIGTVSFDAPYEEQARLREALRHEFNQKFAASHGEAIKAEMLERWANAGTYEEKHDLVRWANGETRRFGLAFSTEKTGVGILAVDKGVLEGRFSVTGKVKGEDEKTSRLYAKTVPELVTQLAVVEAPPRRESFVERTADDSQRRRNR